MMRRKDYDYLMNVLEMTKDCLEQADTKNGLEFLGSGIRFLEVQQTKKPPYPYPFTKIDLRGK